MWHDSDRGAFSREKIESEIERRSVMANSLPPHGLSMNSSWNSPGQNTRVDSLSLLQGIFPTQGLNLDLQHCRRILYQLSHREAQREDYEKVNSDHRVFRTGISSKRWQVVTWDGYIEHLRIPGLVTYQGQGLIKARSTNLKEKQCQRMLKLRQNCTHLTH